MIIDWDLYSVNHLTALPESLSGHWPDPRQLNHSYVVYRGVDTTATVVYSVPLDAEGQPTKDLMTVVAEVATLMYADTVGQIVLRRSEALDLLATPHWRVYCGQYEDEAGLLEDCQAVGITPIGADLNSKIIDAKQKLKLSLTEP